MGAMYACPLTAATDDCERVDIKVKSTWACAKESPSLGQVAKLREEQRDWARDLMVHPQSVRLQSEVFFGLSPPTGKTAQTLLSLILESLY